MLRRLLLGLAVGASGWLIAVSPAGAAAPAGHAPVSTQCSAPLSLALQPGLSFQDLHVTPAADMPTTRVIIHVPLYPGATPSTRDVNRPFLEYPATPYLQTAVAEYDVAAGEDRVEVWYQQRFLACGYGVSGSGTASQSGSEISFGYWFVSTYDPHQSVSIAFEPDGAGGTLIVYLAEAVVLPPRPADSYLPTDMTRVKVTFTYRDISGGLETIHRTLVKPWQLKRLVRAVNALTDVASGPRACAAEGPLATLVFTTRDGKRIRVKNDPACWLVTVGTTRALDDEPGTGVWATLIRILKPGGLPAVEDPLRILIS
jgi:hypothetical protein